MTNRIPPAMPRLLLLTLASALLLTGIVSADDPTTTAQQPRLPGARAVVDASQFESIQAAIDAVPKEGGLVQLPPGVFEISEPIRIHGEDVHLQGAGSSTVIKNANAEGQPTLSLLPPEPFDRKATGSKRPNRWRIQISNLRLVGNEKSGHGIEALWVNEILLHGVTVTAHGGDGIKLDHCYEDPRIADCLITYNKGTGVNLIGCHDIVVSANQFEENQDALHCVDGFNLCMNGNNIDDHLGHGVVIENTYGSVVSGNMIEECAGFALIMDRDCYGNTVSANVIAHNGGGVDLRDAHGCAISANTFTILKEHALRIGPKSGRITASANNFSNSYIGEEQIRRAVDDALAAGITLEGTRDVAIVGNLFSGLTTKAIVTAGEKSERVLVQANVFTEVETDLDNQ